MPGGSESESGGDGGAARAIRGAAAGLSLVEMLVVVAIVAGLAVLLVPGLQAVREAARRTQCANNLRQIGIAFHHHHAARGCFPNNTAVGAIRHHWCAQILPYLDENPLAKSYDYRVRFDHANNRPAVQTPLGFMTCPSAPGGPRQHPRFKITSPAWSAAAADYAASDGPSVTLWNAPATVSYPRPETSEGFLKGATEPGEQGRRLHEITDGTSKSIAVVEAAGRPQVWAFGSMVPDSGRFDSSPVVTKYAALCGWADTNQFAVRGFRQDATQADPANRYKSPGPTMINAANNYGIYAFHPGGAAALFVDGSARFIDADASADVVAAQLTVRAADDALTAAPTTKAQRLERSPAARAQAVRQLRAAYRRPPAEWPPPHVDPGVEWREIGLVPDVVHPESNPYNAAKAELGRLLFFDARLSANGKMACVSCHEPNLGWADGRAVSQPHGRSPDRNTPTIRNVAFQTHLFWDGRAGSLEQQVEDALTNPAEMAADRDAVVGLLARSPGYRRLCADAFAGRPPSFTAVVEAVACFERTIVSGRSRFDHFMRGDETALSDAEILGLDLFRRDARCMNCHHGPTFSDGRFHDLGLSFYGRSKEDLGRHAVTGAPGDRGRFRTPTLRDVTHTTPLMHTGMFELTGVLNMYNAGMVTLRRQPHQRDDPLFPVKSSHLKPLGLNRQDRADLAAFLGALEEPRQRVLPPPLPEIEDEPVTATRHPPAGR